MRCVSYYPFTHFYGLVIVPVLAMTLAFPAIAQISSNSATQGTNPETQGTGAILINIDKSKQKMTVSFRRAEKYVWPVSTGQAGYSTPSGTYTATSMNEIWYSKEWDSTPPCLILFSLGRMVMPSMAPMEARI